jgi:group I intron endonuclease
MYVYCITNKINGKKYVGQHAGKDLDKYWSRTVWFATEGYQGKRLLYRAIRKYGADNFEIKPLVIVGNKEDMDRYEIGMIKAWGTTNPQAGYNITSGGGGSLGVKMSEETRAKMSESRTGLIMPESHRQKLSERSKGNKYSLGKKMTKDNFDKLMAAHKGAKRTEEARKRMSDAHKGKKWTDKQRFGRHTRYHLSKPNTDCKFCFPQSSLTQSIT